MTTRANKCVCVCVVYIHRYILHQTSRVSFALSDLRNRSQSRSVLERVCALDIRFHNPADCSNQTLRRATLELAAHTRVFRATFRIDRTYINKLFCQVERFEAGTHNRRDVYSTSSCCARAEGGKGDEEGVKERRDEHVPTFIGGRPEVFPPCQVSRDH